MRCVLLMESKCSCDAVSILFIYNLFFTHLFRLICGRRVRVELSTGKSRHEKMGRGGPDRGFGGGGGGGRDRDGRGPYGGGSPGRDRGMARREPYPRGGPERGRGFDDRGYAGRHRYSR